MNQTTRQPNVSVKNAGPSVRPLDFVRRLEPEKPRPAAISDLDAGFLAGSRLAALDGLLRGDPLWAGAFRHRLALAAAAATVKQAGRGEDEPALRDAWLLRRPGGDPGPAGRHLLAWRLLAASPNAPTDRAIEAATEAFGLKPSTTFQDIEAAIQNLPIEGSPVTAAASIATWLLSQNPDAGCLALWLADAVLAKHMRWPFALPLLAAHVHHPSLKHQGRRVRPGDPAWPQICCLATAHAAAQASDLANHLSRRTEKLLAVAPKLRAKQSARVIAALLADDAISPASLKNLMPERALRRLFDRLIALDAIRELSGRTTFRIYGL